jgi:hypothetical protein
MILRILFVLEKCLLQVRAKGENEMERIEQEHNDFIWFRKYVHEMFLSTREKEM